MDYDKFLTDYDWVKNAHYYAAMREDVKIKKATSPAAQDPLVAISQDPELEQANFDALTAAMEALCNGS